MTPNQLLIILSAIVACMFAFKLAQARYDRHRRNISYKQYKNHE